MAGSEEELKSLLMRVKEKSEKVGLKLNIKKKQIRLPGWLSSKEFTSHGRRHRFDPGPRKIPHVSEQLLSVCSRACSLQLLQPHTLKPMLCNKKPPQ